MLFIFLNFVLLLKHRQNVRVVMMKTVKFYKLNIYSKHPIYLLNLHIEPTDEYREIEYILPDGFEAIETECGETHIFKKGYRCKIATHSCGRPQIQYKIGSSWPVLQKAAKAKNLLDDVRVENDYKIKK